MAIVQSEITDFLLTDTADTGRLEVIETTYTIGFNFDSYKNVELMLECFMTISSIFSKAIICPFSLSFPALVDNEGWSEYINIELKSSRPLIYEEYKRLSEALYKLSWSCFIEDQETSIKTVIKKEYINIDSELIIRDYI